MSDADPAEEDMSTVALTAQVQALNDKLNEQAKDRHKLNTAMGTTLLNVGNQLLGVEAAVTKLGADVQACTGLVTRLSDRMLGNEAMQTTGLVAEGAAMRAELNALKAEFSTLRNRVIGGFLVITGTAAVWAWIQSHWLGPKP